MLCVNVICQVTDAPASFLQHDAARDPGTCTALIDHDATDDLGTAEAQYSYNGIDCFMMFLDKIRIGELCVTPCNTLFWNRDRGVCSCA